MARTIFNRFGVPPQTRAASSASAAPGRRVVSPAAHGFLFSMPVVDDPPTTTFTFTFTSKGYNVPTNFFHKRVSTIRG